MGVPKALLRDGHGVPNMDRAVGALLDAGCASVTVVLGAAAHQARALLDEAGWGADPAVDMVVADDWAEGMGASLRAGLARLAETGGAPEDAALVTLVDLPDVDADVMARVAAGAHGGSLVRATYDGRPGHPVLIGRRHWEGVVATARGDHGAREYLAEHAASGCECGDLATGRDLDRPEDL